MPLGLASLRHLQPLLDAAWREGWDPDGYRDKFPNGLARSSGLVEQDATGRWRLASLRHLQSHLDRAWRSGYDPDGFRDRLPNGGQLEGTQLRLRGRDVATLLKSLGFKVEVVKSTRTRPDNSHPGLARWLDDHFRQKNPSVIYFKVDGGGVL